MPASMKGVRLGTQGDRQWGRDFGRPCFHGALVKTRPRPILAEEQQALIGGGQVRRIRCEERQRFGQRIVAAHSLGNAQQGDENYPATTPRRLGTPLPARHPGGRKLRGPGTLSRHLLQGQRIVGQEALFRHTATSGVPGAGARTRPCPPTDHRPNGPSGTRLRSAGPPLRASCDGSRPGCRMR